MQQAETGSNVLTWTFVFTQAPPLEQIWRICGVQGISESSFGQRSSQYVKLCLAELCLSSRAVLSYFFRSLWLGSVTHLKLCKYFGWIKPLFFPLLPVLLVVMLTPGPSHTGRGVWTHASQTTSECGLSDQILHESSMCHRCVHAWTQRWAHVIETLRIDVTTRSERGLAVFKLVWLYFYSERE